MNSRLLATPAVALALLVSSPALAQDPPPADPAPADAGVSADATLGVDAEVGADAAAPAEETTGDAAAADGDFDPSDGRAGDPLPIAQAQRPLVLPHLWLSPNLGVNVMRLALGPASSTFVLMNLGATLGLGDIAEVEVVPFASALSPSFSYGAALGGTVRFVDTETLELGGRVRALFTDNGVAITPGIPVRVHASDMIRIDTGAFVGINTASETVALASFDINPVAAGPGIPLSLTVSATEEISIGASTGFGISDFENAGDTIFVPLGVAAGYTVPVDGKPLVDLGVGFGFPFFIYTLSPDTIVTELWAINFTGRANFDLGDMMQ